MLQSHQVEELISVITSMDRTTLVRQFREYRAGFPVDLTDQFLETTPLDRLQHVFLALCLQCQQMPEIDDETLDVRAHAVC